MSEDKPPPNVPTAGAEGSGAKTIQKKKQQGQRRHGNPHSPPAAPKFTGKNPECLAIFQLPSESKNLRQFEESRTQHLPAFLSKNASSKTYTYLRSLFGDSIETPIVPPPDDPKNPEDPFQMKKWEIKMRRQAEEEDDLNHSLSRLFDLIWGQCSLALQSKLKSYPECTAKRNTADCVWLLTTIQALGHHHDRSNNKAVSLHEAWRNYYSYRQQPGVTLEQAYEDFMQLRATITNLGGELGGDYEALTTSTDGSIAFRQNLAAEISGSIRFLYAVDDTYQSVRLKLYNDLPTIGDTYPKTLVDTLSLLQHHKPAPHQSFPRRSPQPTQSTRPDQCRRADYNAGHFTFTQYFQKLSQKERSSLPQTPGRNGVEKGVTCWTCGHVGHRSTDCLDPNNPLPDYENFIATHKNLFTLVHYNLAHEHQGIPPTWVLLDSESSVSVFHSRDLVTNIRPSSRAVSVSTNGGGQRYTLVADVRNLGTVWYHPESIANILSLSHVTQVCRVTADMGPDSNSGLLLHRRDGSIMPFTKRPNGLFAFDTATDNIISAPDAHYPAVSLVKTVSQAKSNFTRREIEGADAARTLYRKLGRPSEQHFESILRNNLIRNCPVTPDDAKRALLIYGPDPATLKGKTTRSAPAPHVPTFKAITIPAPILQHHRHVCLCIDFFYVQGKPFFHTISRKIGFRTITAVTNRTKRTIWTALVSVIRLYHHRGFLIPDIHADQEFECIRDTLLPIKLTTVPLNAHVPEIERSIRTVKERTRATIHGLPFQRIPSVLVDAIIESAISNLNRFPRQDGVSDTMSPLTIMTGRPNPDYNDLPLELGEYVQVHENNDPTNSMRARTLGAIALLPDDDRRTHRFISLSTGRIIKRDHWTAMNMPQSAIERINALAFKERQPLIQDSGFLFEWRPNNTIENEAFDDDFAPNIPSLDDDELEEGVFEPINEVDRLLYDATRELVLPPKYLDDLEYDPTSVGETDDNDETVGETVENHETVGETDENHETVGETDENHETDENGYDTAIHNDHDTITQSNPDLGTNENNDIEARTYDEEAAIPTTEIAEIPFETPSEASHNETPPEVSHNETIRNEGAPNQGARNEGAEERRVRPERTDVSNTVPQRYNLRQRREPDTSYRFAHSIDNPHSTQSYEKAHSFLQTTCETVQTESDLFKAIFCFTMHTLPEIETESVGEEVAHVLAHVLTNQHSFTQMSAEAGIKKHGRIAEDALLKEFKQLFDRDVFTILDGKTLSAEDKAAALRAVNLIKEKRDGVLKGRTCADGRPQRKLYTKAETTSPTVSSEALAITTIVDAYEGRDIATCDITGAYLNAHIDDYVTMKFTGRAVDVLCQLDPSFKEKIVYEKGRKILYARLNRALYGCVKSALLWYELFSKTLVGLGFKLNPYDPCVANAVIDGKQITVIWYVDDLKISHVNPNVVSNIIEQIEARFGKMNVTRGKVHVFLGMTITFNDDRTATIDMENYLVEAIAESNLDIQGKAATPATKNLFEIDPESPTLPEKPAETFHSIVAKLLYVAVRARMDILLAVGFLCTRVKAPTVQDQRKLRRLLQYLNGTLDLHLRLGADDLHTLLTWVDAAYAVHDDFRSHTGGGMSFGIGAFACKSSKQKLNTKSSTEAEVVGVSDYLPYTLWTQMFLEEQGFELLRNVVYQDNESAMRLEQNGRASAGQKSRHIHIRHFFVTDRVKAGDVQIVHCPTLSMLADFLTKPVQGSLFRKFRDVLLGHAHVRTLLDPESSAPEERVGKRAIPDSGS